MHRHRNQWLTGFRLCERNGITVFPHSAPHTCRPCSCPSFDSFDCRADYPGQTGYSAIRARKDWAITILLGDIFVTDRAVGTNRRSVRVQTAPVPAHRSARKRDPKTNPGSSPAVILTFRLFDRDRNRRSSSAALNDHYRHLVSRRGTLGNLSVDLVNAYEIRRESRKYDTRSEPSDFNRHRRNNK